MRLWLLTPLIFACVPVMAQESGDARAARYYAAGIERPLLRIREGAQLIQACADRLRRVCSKEQRKIAGGYDVIMLLDALTLFPQRLAVDAAAGVARARDLADKISATSAALLREAGEYDRELFARVKATLLVCPAGEGPDYLGSLEPLKRLNYSGFQGATPDELARMLVDDEAREQAYVEQMRAAPREDCVTARTMGEYLMELMNSKLAPWETRVDDHADKGREFDFDQPTKTPEPLQVMRRERDRELAHAVAGNYVTVVATELQIFAHPESETSLKEMADAVERAKQAQ